MLLSDINASRSLQVWCADHNLPVTACRVRMTQLSSLITNLFHNTDSALKLQLLELRSSADASS
jgi:hypothetical protein